MGFRDSLRLRRVPGVCYGFCCGVGCCGVECKGVELSGVVE